MQYIHPSDEPGGRNFMRLVDAFAEAVRRRVDVRLILSQYENTPQYIELLHKAGLSGVLRIQDRVHNIGHRRGLGYFEQIVLEDWEKRADVRVK